MTTISAMIQNALSKFSAASNENRPDEAVMATSNWGNFRVPNRPPAVRRCQASGGPRVPSGDQGPW